MLVDDIENKLYDTLASVLPGTDIIFGNYDVPEPPGTHLVIIPIHMNQLGSAERSSLLQQNTDGDFIRTIKQQYEYYVRFQSVGTDAGSLMTQLAAILDERYYAEMFEYNGFSVSRKTFIRRVPKLREDDWVQSYTFEVYFFIEVDTTTIVPYMEYISIDQTIADREQFYWIPSPPPTP